MNKSIKSAAYALALAAALAGPVSAQNKPSVIIFMADDMTATDIQVMSETKRLIGERGVTFNNSVVDASICCDSRATFQTGQAEHNHGVRGNSPATDGGYEAFKPTEGNSLAVWLQNAGYKTFAFTKNMNGYGGRSDTAPLSEKTYIPPGWNQWFGRVDYHAYRYYDYDYNHNGTLVHRGCNAADYDADFAKQKAIEFIMGKEADPSPIFMWIAPLAPHNAQQGRCSYEVFRGPLPAQRHLHTLDSHNVQHSLNFNEADVSDKPSFIAGLPSLTTQDRSDLDDQVRRRRESLLAVDEMVAAVVQKLYSTGRLENTLVCFTSDNGFLMGEHRIENDKLFPYEESIRVPLICRGPSIPGNETRAQMVSNIDLPATILDAAGVPPGRVLDGRSLYPLMQDATIPWRSALLVQGHVPLSYASPLVRFQGVRTECDKYIEYTNGETELYDLCGDGPRELQNRTNDPAYASLKAARQSTLATLRTCAGPSCWVD